MEFNHVQHGKLITTIRGERQLLNDQLLYNKSKQGDSGNTYWE